MFLHPLAHPLSGSDYAAQFNVLCYKKELHCIVVAIAVNLIDIQFRRSRYIYIYIYTMAM